VSAELAVEVSQCQDEIQDLKAEAAQRREEARKL
jgi:hypothetical protein